MGPFTIGWMGFGISHYLNLSKIPLLRGVAANILFHSLAVVIMAVNVYGFIHGLSMVEMSEDLVQLLETHVQNNPGKFITFLNMVLQSLYFSLALLIDLMGFNNTLTSNQKRLADIRDIAFASLLFPLGIWVCSSFWMVYWMYSDIILPAKIALLFPAWLNHGLHTVPAVFTVMELWIYRYGPTVVNRCFLVIVIVNKYLYGIPLIVERPVTVCGIDLAGVLGAGNISVLTASAVAVCSSAEVISGVLKGATMNEWY
ncbi:unnamed protein product, partial [Meganyctiphanes norvegica]